MSQLNFPILVGGAGPRRAFCLSVLAAILCGLSGHAGAQLYVSSNGNTVGEYDATNGAAINSSLVTGLSHPIGLVISGNTLFVSNFDTNTIGTYNATTGAPIAASFITGLNGPEGLALSGNTLYVANFLSNGVSTYDATTGQVINANFIGPFGSSTMPSASSLTLAGGNLYVSYVTAQMVVAYNATTGAVVPGFVPIVTPPLAHGLAVVGNDLFVAAFSTTDSVGEYDATTGAAINPSFISNLNNPLGLAVSGNNLFVTQTGAVSEFDATTGASINPALVTLTSPVGIAVVPEPGSGLLLSLGMGAFLGRRRRRG